VHKAPRFLPCAPPSSIYELSLWANRPEVKEVKPLVDWMPIWGQDAREKGFDLPLPFGVGLTYTYIDQNMVVSDVKIEGKSAGREHRDAKTTTHTGVFRGDMWLFPFLNVYGLSGRRLASRNQQWFFRTGKYWNPK
jgi:hypothetical protein